MASRHGEQINCNQINLQHSRAATDNLMEIIAQENRHCYDTRTVPIPK